MTGDASGLPKRDMNGQTIWNIRDARQLNSNEKLLLMVIESRGQMWATVAQVIDDMGMSRSTFYKTRNDLKARNLIHVLTRGTNQTTMYRVNREAVRRLLPDRPEQVEYAWPDDDGNDLVGSGSGSDTTESDIGMAEFAGETQAYGTQEDLSDVETEPVVPADSGRPELHIGVRLSSPEENPKRTTKGTVEVHIKETGSEPRLEPKGDFDSFNASLDLAARKGADLVEAILVHSSDAYRASVVAAYNLVQHAENDLQRPDHAYHLRMLLGEYLESEPWLSLDEHVIAEHVSAAWERLSPDVQSMTTGIFDENEREYIVLLGHVIRLES